MSVALIAAGLICLLNPSFGIIDVLPDFIGAFLIMLGMKKIVFLNETTEEVCRKMWTAVLLGMAKFIISVLPSGIEDGIRVVLALAFAVLEIIILIPAVSSVIRCADELQSRYCTEAADKYERRFKNLSIFAGVYIVINSILEFLPELTEITDENIISTVRFTDSKWALHILSTAVCALFFIPVLILLINAFRRFAADRKMVASAVEAAEKVYADDPARWYAKRWSVVRKPFIVSVGLSIFLYIDGIDYFPKAIAAIIICILSLMHAEKLVQRILAVASNVMLVVTSAISNYLLASFFDDYKDETALFWSDDASSRYTVIAGFIIIEALLLFASLLLLSEILKKCKLKQISEFGDFPNEIAAINKEILIFRIFLVVSSLAGVAFPLLRPEMPSLAIVLVIFFGIVTLYFSTRIELDSYAAVGEYDDSKYSKYAKHLERYRRFNK